ncbi:fatty acid desaturas-like protein [Westerdykella ornata]|uniref:Fatty acid desaturas-like protein n=1 Tax=Westerdykella ornata TaxID=318751 RepID=A0A6A6JGU5_WESOR|nr:fatty acid desaturas-like protein [Westerdykella ornata]KAF2275781.1 fatty acid desaturas-like protein [Westerdykella ornata]
MVGLILKPDPDLTLQDQLLLEVFQLRCSPQANTKAAGPEALQVSEHALRNQAHSGIVSHEDIQRREHEIIRHLKALNDPKSPQFEPTIFSSIDTASIKSPFLRKWVIDPYVRCARSLVRNEMDVVMVTHLLLYVTTTIPSAAYLFYNFRWWHGVAHAIMQAYYMGPYTLMMHQHIHMRGIFKKEFAWLDAHFPYIMDPLMGHTWNSYYFHHVKHHHVEGNGPDDLSSTVRYQRDDVLDFLRYLGRFYFLVWFDLPRYFLRKRKLDLALKSAGFEISNYIFLYTVFTYVNWRATIVVFLIPLALMRVAMMLGNWGQHAFVDETEPNSDFRSSITLIDVSSNRYCYNDGYHTSHHLNPLRHWRDHPAAFLSQADQYINEQALVFYNIDYMMISISLLTKNYELLAKHLVPLGAQAKLSLEERAEMLRRKTRRFTEEEIAIKWGKEYARL